MKCVNDTYPPPIMILSHLSRRALRTVILEETFEKRRELLSDLAQNENMMGHNLP
jgi:hypothetical protein